MSALFLRDSSGLAVPLAMDAGKLPGIFSDGRIDGRTVLRRAWPGEEPKDGVGEPKRMV